MLTLQIVNMAVIFAGIFHHNKENTDAIVSTTTDIATPTASDTETGCGSESDGSELLAQLDGLSSQVKQLNQNVRKTGRPDVTSNLQQALELSSLAAIPFNTHKISLKCMNSDARDELGNLIDDLKLETIKMAINAENIVHLPIKGASAVASLLKKAASDVDNSLSLVSSDIETDKQQGNVVSGRPLQTIDSNPREQSIAFQPNSNGYYNFYSPYDYAPYHPPLNNVGMPGN